MPAITITATNTGTDTFTAAAHGLTTGDRFRLRNVGGALPAATPALAGATDYFAIVIDANNLKASDTNAHALAGTGIVDLTGSGSGTTTIEYGLPYCIPNVVAAQGGQIKSASINADWNAMVALYDLLTGQAQSVFSGVTLAGLLTANGGLTAAGAITLASLVAPSGTAPLKASTAGALSVGYDPVAHNIALAVAASGASISNVGGFPALALSTSTQANWLPLTLPVGFRIASWQVQLQKASASGTITAQLWDVNGLTGAGAQVGSTQSNSANNPGNIQLGQSSLSTVVTAGHSYLLVLQGGGVTGDFALGYSATPG
jgi:hypothetical protein